MGLSRTIDGGDGGDGCTGAIGSRPTSYSFAPQDTRTFNGVSGLFLNTRNKASCNGIVIAWDFCYYINFQQNTDTDVMLSFQAGVWKKKGGKYHMVNSTTIESSIPIQEKGFQFACQYQPLQENETFAVQEGDIVGTHVKDLDENLVPVLGTCGVTEPCCGLIIIDISNITSPIFESDFYDSSHSLYLMAIIGLWHKLQYNNRVDKIPPYDFQVIILQTALTHPLRCVLVLIHQLVLIQ